MSQREAETKVEIAEREVKAKYGWKPASRPSEGRTGVRDVRRLRLPRWRGCDPRQISLNIRDEHIPEEAHTPAAGHNSPGALHSKPAAARNRPAAVEHKPARRSLPQ